MSVAAYEWHKTSIGEIVRCDCCQSAVPTGLFPRHDGTRRHLCEFCATSFVIEMTERQRDGTAILLAQAVNHIKLAVGAFPV